MSINWAVLPPDDPLHFQGPQSFNTYPTLIATVYHPITYQSINIFATPTFHHSAACHPLAPTTELERRQHISKHPNFQLGSLHRNIMDRTDEELDRDWVPSGRRPQSTIARSFSAELMDIFRIENSVTDLDEQIDKRKQQVTSGQTELQALEAQLKEMEKRLQTSKSGAFSGSPRGQRQPLANTFGSTTQSTGKELPQRPLQASSRPGTAKQAQHVPMHGGAMPPTPTASEGESDLVNTSHDRDAETASFADYVIVPKDGEDRDS
ncbi:hypothetical protein RRF57_006945 [Xylaria bambusicola]|uniref:Uncharacterized protein n=1 Tax=Xylaria bambusicola TaxID=326684 RepID=A0AAN7UR75_9PEZI